MTKMTFSECHQEDIAMDYEKFYDMVREEIQRHDEIYRGRGEKRPAPMKIDAGLNHISLSDT